MADDFKTKLEQSDFSNLDDINGLTAPDPHSKPSKSKVPNRDKESPGAGTAKRRCVSTACIACRKRKSKCDGNTPSCAACSSVYNTECIYDPNSDHRRKGVYKKDIDNLKTRNSTLQTLIQAILNYPEHEVPDLVKQIRTCESLDDVAESIIARNNALADDDISEDDELDDNGTPTSVPRFEKELQGKMGNLRLDNGSISIIGGTSNLIFIGTDGEDNGYSADELEPYSSDVEPIASWTEVTSDPRLIVHLLNMYFTWHYTYFTTLSRSLFWRDFKQGKPSQDHRRKTIYCTPLLVNAMLALGCHFTSWQEARADPQNPATAGDHFFKEAKRLILENDEHEKPCLATVQALALMSVREAGCGREARGWVYSGMSFRMAYDLGLNIESGTARLDEEEVDARRMTLWGCFLFDKCWSNYLGRLPQLSLSNIATPKFDVFPEEDAEVWRPHLDTGPGSSHSQPSRTRAVALQISSLCEISGDLLHYFYHPSNFEKPPGKQAELKKLSELHTRLEAWRKNLPKEMEPREGQLPSILVMHMFFQLLYIHLFRPFLKYKPSNTPLPAHVSPRKFLMNAAAAISKLLRLYRRTYGLRQICNIAIYISHMACTVHVLNLPDKLASRDLVYGLSHLEEISESWLCARRTLAILQQVSRRWKVELPDAAEKIFERVESKYGQFNPQDVLTPRSDSQEPPILPPANTQTHLPPESKVPMNSHPDANLQRQQHHRQSPVTNGNYLANTIPLATSPTPFLPRPNGALSLPPQEATELARISRQHAYVLPQTYQPSHSTAQESWAGNSSSGGGHNGTPTNSQLASQTQFNGVEGLLQDQDYYLRDSHQFFAWWNGVDPGSDTLGENYGGAGTPGSGGTRTPGVTTAGGMDGYVNGVGATLGFGQNGIHPHMGTGRSGETGIANGAFDVEATFADYRDRRSRTNGESGGYGGAMEDDDVS